MLSENEELKRDITTAFSKVSNVYDSGKNKFFSDIGKISAEKMNIAQGSTVLDIATGRGAFLYRAYDHSAPSGKVIGIDLAQGMIDSTTEEIKEKGLDIELLLMDAEALDFEDNSFDYVFCGFAIFFFPNLERALSEIYRVLKPNGKFGVSTFNADPVSDEEWFVDIIKKHLKRENHEEEQEDKKTSPVFDTIEGMRNIFKGAGFNHIEVSNENLEYYYTEDEWWDELFTHGGIRTMDKFTSEKLELFKADVYAKLRELKTAKGILRTISVLFTYGIK